MRGLTPAERRLLELPPTDWDGAPVVDDSEELRALVTRGLFVVVDEDAEAFGLQRTALARDVLRYDEAARRGLP